MSFKIDASKAENLSDKVLSERETRKRLLTHARMIGCEKDMLILLDKLDNMLRNCTNEKERKDMAKLGIVQIYSLLGGGGKLYVDNQLVCDDEGK